MSRIIFLDAGPLGIITNSKTPPTALTTHVLRWTLDLVRGGNRIIVPAIADFEVRRELLRAQMTDSLALLDAWNAAQPERYLPLTDTALKRAAQLWASARNTGTLPADPKELNGDVVLAAQVLDYQTAHALATTDILLATVNVGHLSLFVPAERWTDIKP